MFYLPLISGAVFVAAAAVLASQARIVVAGNAIPRRALGLLAAFAAVRGMTHWAEIAVLVDGGTLGGPATAAAMVRVALLAASFALLFGFALALIAPEARRSSRVPAIAASALVAWGISLAALLGSAHVAGRSLPSDTLVASTRWLLEVPANVCAAIALFGFARSIELENWVGSRLVRGAAIAFVVHGLSDALEMLPPFGASWHSGAGVLWHDALEVVGVASSAAIAFLLSEVLVFQTAQRLRREETYLRDDFIALVTHELGNPVAAIELAAKRLELGCTAARSLEPRLSDDVRACTVTLRRIVADLLDTSRIHARELAIAPTRVDLRPVLERAAAIASARAPDRPPVAVTCPAPLAPVLADPARLEQILGNLLSNASQYSSPGSPVALAAEQGDGRVTLCVLNEGSSIDPGDATRIFSRHYRAHAADRGGARGLGLGLYVARALVEAQGGRIWVDSRVRRTAFCFTLPLATNVHPPAKAAVREPRHARR